MSDITKMLKRREEVQRRKDLQASPAERMEKLAALQNAAFELLRSSPEGYQSFLRRNYKSRRAEVIDGTWRPVSADRSFALTNSPTPHETDGSQESFPTDLACRPLLSRFAFLCMSHLQILTILASRSLQRPDASNEE